MCHFLHSGRHFLSVLLKSIKIAHTTHTHTHALYRCSIQSHVKDAGCRRFLRLPFMCIVPRRAGSSSARDASRATRHHVLPRHPNSPQTHTSPTPLASICIMAADTYMSICTPLRLSLQTKKAAKRGGNGTAVMSPDEGQGSLAARRRPERDRVWTPWASPRFFPRCACDLCAVFSA